MIKSKIVTLAVAIIISANVFAASIEESLSHLQTQWADIKYQQPKSSRENLFAALTADSKLRLSEHPSSAELKIWHAIILSSQAGEIGGLNALSLVKEAKMLLEESIDSNPGILDGSAETTLGSLYYQVPSWPIGFGSDEKAKAFLLKGLSYNPSGIDSNFWYADFLSEQNETEEAKEFYLKALSAPPRRGRETADQGRIEDVQAALRNL